jgi:hypothetical protein
MIAGSERAGTVGGSIATGTPPGILGGPALSSIVMVRLDRTIGANTPVRAIVGTPMARSSRTMTLRGPRDAPTFARRPGPRRQVAIPTP